MALRYEAWFWRANFLKWRDLYRSFLLGKSSRARQKTFLEWRLLLWRVAGWGRHWLGQLQLFRWSSVLRRDAELLPSRFWAAYKLIFWVLRRVQSGITFWIWENSWDWWRLWGLLFIKSAVRRWTAHRQQNGCLVWRSVGVWSEKRQRKTSQPVQKPDNFRRVELRLTYWSWTNNSLLPRPAGKPTKYQLIKSG